MPHGDELRALATSLLNVAKQARSDTTEALEALESAATEVSEAWSGSSIGFHARVYYAELASPPPGAHFSQEWGFLGTFQGTTGDWREFAYEDVYNEVLRRAGEPDTARIEQTTAMAATAVDEARAALASIIAAAGPEIDAHIEKLLAEANDLTILTATRATELQIRAGTVMSRDTTALGQGFQSSPHHAVIGLVVGCRSAIHACEEIARIADRVADHLERLGLSRQRDRRAAGTKVFIGHGRSPLWREFKDFVQDRLGLSWDEFNRVPVAGVTNVERLVQMMDDAGIAFLILTAEDEQADGTVVPRQNVVHEAGLFQGRLGFTRAIVLLEEGCEEFSNIAGLGQIRFPVGNISAAFEEVRRVLEREGFVR